jgi:hypothetical protein
MNDFKTTPHKDKDHMSIECMELLMNIGDFYVKGTKYDLSTKLQPLLEALLEQISNEYNVPVYVLRNLASHYEAYGRQTAGL